MAIFCGACGHENDGAARACSACGQPIAVSREARTADPRARRGATPASVDSASVDSASSPASGSWDAPEDDPLLGQVLADRYHVESVIAEGGMGRVYLGTQRIGTLSRKVAIKILHEELSHEPSLRRRFNRECEVVVSLTHPNTIRFHDFGELPDGRLFIVMEHIDGRSLTRILGREGPLPAARVEHLLDQIAGSIEEAHQRGVIHRDLKPDNILLTTVGLDDDFVKVLDFGIAKRADGTESAALTLAGTLVGTPEYMSPEQITGGTVDARSDVYSLGLIVYELLTGEPPFQASTPLEWAARHTTADPRSFDDFEATRDLAPHRRDAVLAALAKLPRERPASARAFAAAFAGREGLAAPPPAVPRRRPAQSPVDATAPTLEVVGGVPRRPRDEDGVALPPAPWLSKKAWLGGAGLVLALTVFGGLAAHLWPAPPPLAPAPVAIVDAGPPDAGADAGSDAGQPPPTVEEWAAETYAAQRVDHPERATGAPDGRFATLRPGGTLTLSLAGERLAAADGTPLPDVRLELGEGGPLRVEVGLERTRLTTVASELDGKRDLDLDGFQLQGVRYVRLRNRGTGPLTLDAVGAYHSRD